MGLASGGALVSWSDLGPRDVRRDGKNSGLGWEKAMISILKYAEDSHTEGEMRLEMGASWIHRRGVSLPFRMF